MPVSARIFVRPTSQLQAGKAGSDPCQSLSSILQGGLDKQMDGSSPVCSSAENTPVTHATGDV